MEILQQKRQSRASLNRTITMLADQLGEAERERDALRDVLSASLDLNHRLQERLDRTQDSLRRLLESVRSAREDEPRLAA